VRRAGHSSRGVLPTVGCLKCVIVKRRKMRRPRPLGAVEPWGRGGTYLPTIYPPTQSVTTFSGTTTHMFNAAIGQCRPTGPCLDFRAVTYVFACDNSVYIFVFLRLRYFVPGVVINFVAMPNVIVL
jgi:hypothetical protein